MDLARSVSRLPTSVQDGDETARHFDELIVRLQLARLKGTKDGARLQARVLELLLPGSSALPVTGHADERVRRE